MGDSGRAVRLEHALAVAYQYLSRRERTEAEMRAHLAAKGIESPTVDEAASELGEQGYLDDARFARLFAQDKRELERWGSDRIRRTLTARGIERELIEAALGAEEQIGELERAVAVLRRRFPTPPGDPRERERALGLLLRKGYDSDLALDALARHGMADADDRW
jgi:regulatory protein